MCIKRWKVKKFLAHQQNIISGSNLSIMSCDAILCFKFPAYCIPNAQYGNHLLMWKKLCWWTLVFTGVAIKATVETLLVASSKLNSVKLTATSTINFVFRATPMWIVLVSRSSTYLQVLKHRRHKHYRPA